MLKFRKKNIVSVLVFTGVISPNMGRRKGLNVQDYDKSIEQAFQNGAYETKSPQPLSLMRKTRLTSRQRDR